MCFLAGCSTAWELELVCGFWCRVKESFLEEQTAARTENQNYRANCNEIQLLLFR